MKKTLAIVLVAVLALGLVACGGTASSTVTSSVATSEFKDGTYTAEASEANYGWTDTLTVTYKDGVVTEAKYDAVDADGALKSEATAESYPMDPHPTVWIPEINANILKAGNAADIEAVAGATNSSNNAKVLMDAVEEAAKAGNTETVKVEMPAE